MKAPRALLVALALLSATACQDDTKKTATAPAESVKANASVSAAANVSSVCKAYEKERALRQLGAGSKTGAANAEAAAEIAALDAAIADACN